MNSEHMTREYVNAMEMLVIEEVDRQLSQFPEHLQQYIKRFEVETYALNRLPALYASSREGLELQKKRGSTEYDGEIYNSVRQGLAAVLRDPLRRSTPLVSEDEKEYQKTLLDLLKKLPEQRDFRRVVARAIRQTVSSDPQKTAQKTPDSVSPPPAKSADRQPGGKTARDRKRPARPPAAPSRNTNAKPPASSESKNDPGWDGDRLYR